MKNKSCEYFEELISAELDHELRKTEKAELNMHLEHCSSCAVFKTNAAKLKTGIKKAFSAADETSIIRAQKKPVSGLKSTLFLSLYYALPAAAFLLFLVFAPRAQQHLTLSAILTDSLQSQQSISKYTGIYKKLSSPLSSFSYYLTGNENYTEIAQAETGYSDVLNDYSESYDLNAYLGESIFSLPQSE